MAWLIDLIPPNRPWYSFRILTVAMSGLSGARIDTLDLESVLESETGRGWAKKASNVLRAVLKSWYEKRPVRYALKPSMPIGIECFRTHWKLAFNCSRRLSTGLLGCD